MRGVLKYHDRIFCQRIENAGVHVLASATKQYRNNEGSKNVELSIHVALGLNVLELEHVAKVLTHYPCTVANVGHYGSFVYRNCVYALKEFLYIQRDRKFWGVLPYL